MVRHIDLMNRQSTLLCCLATALVLVLVSCSTARPLSRSDEKIRASILKRMPLGCSSDQVRAFIKEKHWSVYSESRDKGFVMRRPGQNEAYSAEVGSSFVACELGATHFVMFPFETTKYAYWGFDKSGRLIDVWVDENTDAP
jgi:hypothetical protein